LFCYTIPEFLIFNFKFLIKKKIENKKLKIENEVKFFDMME